MITQEIIDERRSRPFTAQGRRPMLGITRKSQGEIANHFLTDDSWIIPESLIDKFYELDDESYSETGVTQFVLMPRLCGIKTVSTDAERLFEIIFSTLDKEVSAVLYGEVTSAFDRTSPNVTEVLMSPIYHISQNGDQSRFNQLSHEDYLGLSGIVCDLLAETQI